MGSWEERLGHAVGEEDVRMWSAPREARSPCTLLGCPLALGCCCSCFESNFLCAACDRRWEEHETFFETEETRRRGGRPHGERATWAQGPLKGL